MRFGMGYGAWTGGPRGDGHRHGGRDHGPEHAAWKHGGGPRGRGRRLFDGGELKLVMLKLSADAPRHGYDLIREIEGLTGAAMRRARASSIRRTACSTKWG